jgi:hypothetical protein
MGLETLVRPWVVDQISKGQRGMLSIGAPGRSLNVKPDTGGGKTGGGSILELKL